MPNRRYLCLQRSQPGGPKPSPAQMQEMYATFNAWKEKFKDQILDLGGRLKPDGKVVNAAGAVDGPFVEVKEVVGGYMLIAAENYEQAIEIATGCPGIVSPGSSVEIREIMDA